MSRTLFDTNVVLDVLLDRWPFVDASAVVWAAAETGATEGVLAAHALTTIHYVLRSELGVAKTRRVVSAILTVFGVADVDAAVIHDALQLSFSDFEDAVTAAAARLAGCDYIVTRDPRGLRGFSIRCLTPEAAVPLLRNGPRR